MEIRPEIVRYYTNSGIEINRLDESTSRLEKVRTQEIISRYLSKKATKILDVGGGAGAYSLWLSEMGHEVHLVDPVPLHIEEAKKRSQRSTKPLTSVRLGEARLLEFEEESFDLVLLLGPLYHLTEREERTAALVEAKRVTKPGGLVLCVAISRFAFLTDVSFHSVEIGQKTLDRVIGHIRSGQLRNPEENPNSFTTAYAHLPEELAAEISEGGLRVEKLLAIESFGWLLPEFQAKWENPAYRDSLLSVIKVVESERSLLGISAHILAVARKAEDVNVKVTGSIVIRKAE